MRDFNWLVPTLRRVPHDKVNAERILRAIKPLLKKRIYKEDHGLLECLFYLYQLRFEFENAFYAILKKRDPIIFAFLERHTINFPMHPNLAKLLKIDPVKTV